MSLLLNVVLLILAVYVGLRKLVALSHDAREPPLIENGIPFITPIFGMMRWRNRYYNRLRDIHPHPIYTLQFPGQKLYIINSVPLIPPIQRAYKTLTFQAISDQFAKLICDVSDTATRISIQRLEEWTKGGKDAAYSPSHVLFSGLRPGKEFEEMNRVVVERLKGCVDGLGEGKTVGLLEWIREELVRAIGEGVYGEGNPYREKEMRDAFWTYESSLGTLSLNILPSLLARHGIRARTYATTIFTSYFTNGPPPTAGSMTRQRHAYHLEHKYPLSDIAKFEFGNGIAVFSNTIPIAFWTLFHIFMDSGLVEGIRGEIEGQLTRTRDQDGEETLTLPLNALKTNCPLLMSTFKETLRLHASGVGVRKVMEPFELSVPSSATSPSPETYLLTPNALIIMPASVQHSSPEIWGSDVHKFVPTRFLPSASQSTIDGITRPKINPTAFRAFGGGITLCPGRHFATATILSLVAMLVLDYDVVPVKGNGEWKEPTSEKAALTAAVRGPDADIMVRITRREGAQRWRWGFGDGVGQGMGIGGEDGEEEGGVDGDGLGM